MLYWLILFISSDIGVTRVLVVPADSEKIGKEVCIGDITSFQWKDFFGTKWLKSVGVQDITTDDFLLTYRFKGEFWICFDILQILMYPNIVSY